MEAKIINKAACVAQQDLGKETETWLRLLMVPRLGPIKLRALYHALANHWSSLETDQLRLLGLSHQQCQAFHHPMLRRLEQVQHWLAQNKCTLLPLNHVHYPETLQALPDAPPVLFVAGDTGLLSSAQLALVGSRRCTPYGTQWGSYFATALAAKGLTITSGLAVGIDAVGHRAALDSGGQTVAVLGSGLQTLYPHCHHALAQRIVAAGGALVTEHLPDIAPLPWHFPRRNRIISGLSLGVLVVEASLRSGSLITARHALDQGREVFALPGPLDNENSQGCHQLIRQGAWLVSQPEEVLEQLNSSLQWLTLPKVPLTRSTEMTLDRVEAVPFPEILANISGESTSVDSIAERVGQPVADIVVKLIELELTGWIAAVPGGYVQCKKASHV